MCFLFNFFLYLFLVWRVLCFTNNERAGRRKLETDWTPHGNSIVSFKLKVQLKFTTIIADFSDPLTPSLLRVSCLLFSRRRCWLCCVCMCQSKLSWIICGPFWHVGWHLSVQVFVFSIVPTVGNSNTGAATFIRRLSCHLYTAFKLLKRRKCVYNF